MISLAESTYTLSEKIGNLQWPRVDGFQTALSSMNKVIPEASRIVDGLTSVSDAFAATNQLVKSSGTPAQRGAYACRLN